ncbi:MAG: hypothetical protein FWH57_12435 [Oscillospiraceae bacterium]|nr:hypothetical protein [Oscillospiraceae bacterium]
MADLDFDMKINWEREGFSLDELDVIEKQAELFENCQSALNVDAFDFIEKFMQSHIAEDTASFSTAQNEQIGKALLRAVGIKPLQEQKYSEALYWIGYLYRYWTLMGTPSKDVIKVAPVEKAYILYNGYHTLGVQEAIMRFVQERGASRFG